MGLLRDTEFAGWARDGNARKDPTGKETAR